MRAISGRKRLHSEAAEGTKKVDGPRAENTYSALKMTEKSAELAGWGAGSEAQKDI